MMGATGSHLTGSAHEYWLQGREAIQRIDESVERAVRERPLTTIFAAVGFGLAVGILLTLACPASFPQLKRRG